MSYRSVKCFINKISYNVFGFSLNLVQLNYNPRCGPNSDAGFYFVKQLVFFLNMSFKLLLLEIIIYKRRLSGQDKFKESDCMRPCK